MEYNCGAFIMALYLGDVYGLLSPCLFNLYAEYIMRNTGLEEAQAGIRLLGEISVTSDMQMTPPLWQKMKIMASGPIISWEIDGEAVETVSDCIFLGSKITADGDCSHEIKRRLLLGRKVMTNNTL